MMHKMAFASLAALGMAAFGMASSPQSFAGMAEPAPTTLWARDALTVIARPLDSGETGASSGSVLEIADHGRVIYGSRNIYKPTSLAVLWQQKDPVADKNIMGPNAVLSAIPVTAPDELELTVINFAANPTVQIISLPSNKPPSIREQNGKPEMIVPFTLAAFNAPASQLSSVDLPVQWDGSRFAIDIGNIKKLPPQRALQAMLLDMRAELATWTITRYDGGGTNLQAAAPKTVTSLLDLILNGQSHAAKNLLYQAWPHDLPGRALYWRDLSLKIKSDPLWADLGLARLPNTNALVVP